MAATKQHVPVVVRRQQKHEAEQAIRDLEARGFVLIFPLTEFKTDGKEFKRDSYNRKIFVKNTFGSTWMAKLRRKDAPVYQ